MNRTTSLQTRVAIVDDHHLVCAAIAELIQLDPRFNIVAQANDAESAEPLFTRKDIDVILLDLDMPGKHGTELLKSLNGGPRACILTIHTEAHFVTQCIKSGALGYVSKQAAPEELVKALFAVSRGETYLSIDVQTAAASAAFKTAKSNLTEREVEVLQLSARGAPSSEIAAKLNISRRTAEAHRANLMKKLALKTQTDRVRYAVRHRIIEV